jgi:hypothetical protein
VPIAGGWGDARAVDGVAAASMVWRCRTDSPEDRLQNFPRRPSFS